MNLAFSFLNDFDDDDDDADAADDDDDENKDDDDDDDDYDDDADAVEGLFGEAQSGRKATSLVRFGMFLRSIS